MYDFIDRDVAMLDRGAQLLLWAMRAWVQARAARTCPGPAIAPAFARFGVLGALPHFHGVMGELSRDAIRAMAFAPHCCRCVGEDEALLLALFRAAGSEPAERVEATAAMLVTEAGVAPLLAALTAAVRKLADAGLTPGLAGA